MAEEDWREGEVAMTAPEENAEFVRKIVGEARKDACQIAVMISLLECQNTGGVNERLNASGAAEAGLVLRDALWAYLVTIIQRTFSKSHKDDDLHLRRAVKILQKKPEIRSQFEGSNDELCDACRFLRGIDPSFSLRTDPGRFMV